MIPGRTMSKCISELFNKTLPILKEIEGEKVISVLKFFFSTIDNTLKSKYEEKLLSVCDSITKFNKLKFNKKCNQSCEYAKLCVNY